MNHGAVFIAGDAGRHAKIHLHGTRDHTYKQPGAVSPEHQGFEHPVQVLPQLLRHVGGLQVLFVHLIGDQRIRNAGGVQEPGSVCFL